jgi:hypothetical protein
LAGGKGQGEDARATGTAISQGLENALSIRGGIERLAELADARFLRLCLHGYNH